MLIHSKKWLLKTMSKLPHSKTEAALDSPRSRQCLTTERKKIGREKRERGGNAGKRRAQHRVASRPDQHGAPCTSCAGWQGIALTVLSTEKSAINGQQIKKKSQKHSLPCPRSGSSNGPAGGGKDGSWVRHRIARTNQRPTSMGIKQRTPHGACERAEKGV